MRRLGRLVFWLLVLELGLAFWLGLRMRRQFEAPLRIIGQSIAEPPAPPAAAPRAPVRRLRS